MVNDPPPWTRSEHLPHPTWNLGRTSTSTPSPPGSRSEHLTPPHQVRTSTPPHLGPGQNIYPLPQGPGQNIYPAPTWNPGRTSTPPPWDQVRTSTPLGPGQNIYPLPPGSIGRRAVRILLECILVYTYCFRRKVDVAGTVYNTGKTFLCGFAGYQNG